MGLPRSLMLLNLSLRVSAGDVLEAGEFLSSMMFLPVNPIEMGCNGWSLGSRVRSVSLKGLFHHDFQKLVVVGCGYLVFGGGSISGASFSHHCPRGWKDLGGGFPGHGAGPVAHQALPAPSSHAKPVPYRAGPDGHHSPCRAPLQRAPRLALS